MTLSARLTRLLFFSGVAVLATAALAPRLASSPAASAQQAAMLALQDCEQLCGEQGFRFRYVSGDADGQGRKTRCVCGAEPEAKTTRAQAGPKKKKGCRYPARGSR